MNFRDAQERQQGHDENHHQDIYTLSYPQRMNHYTHHFSKYVGRLCRDYPNDEQREENLEKTIADCAIVALAAANTLDLDINSELEEMTTLEANDIESWGSEINMNSEERSVDEVHQWWSEKLAIATGKMANAMESLDHMEPVRVRDVLEENTMDIVLNLLVASDSADVGLEDLLTERWETIESNSIL